eukprot:349652-Chlamydomonas_euryale.AAC.2
MVAWHRLLLKSRAAGCRASGCRRWGRISQVESILDVNQNALLKPFRLEPKTQTSTVLKGPRKGRCRSEPQLSTP